MSPPELVRASIAHTTGNPTVDSSAYVAIEDGGLLVDRGRIVATGDFATIRAAHPEADVLDWRGGFVLPGLVDAHVHFPQTRVLGHLGWPLLEWLDRVALPEEARLADASYATHVADTFVRALAAHGTTSAAVFGSHFAPAVEALFEAAARTGLRISAGLVLADRQLRPDLHTTPDRAYADSRRLIEHFHGRGRLTYAVTPRFAYSASDALLDVCATLLREFPSVGCHTHVNEQPAEIRAVAAHFPWATDYFAVYERYGLSGRRAILAHNVHPTTAELERLAATHTSIAHCPCSNAALGSGIFPLGRHTAAGVHCALGTDVGGGTGFGILKEALQAHLMQRVAPSPSTVPTEHLLYLSTLAGAEAMRLDDITGDLSPGKAADFIYIRAPEGSVLAEVLSGVSSVTEGLSAVFTLAGQDAIREVRVDGVVVHRAAAQP